MEYNYINLLIAILCAALISFTSTPIARVLAYKINAIDIPRDDRRMHRTPIPRLGGLAIFFAFIVTSLLFCQIDSTILTLALGGMVIVALGIIDDVFRINAWLKFAIEIAVAFIPVSQGMTIDFINFFGHYVVLGPLSIPITVIWIVGLTNAINLIDGLDGLSCGVSSICALSLLFVALSLAENPTFILVTGILAGSCIGFLPFNTNPAKIFMGDTGALFLGYTLSLLSIQGLFKLQTVLSFFIPLLIFGLPLFDTVFAFIRRIIHGRSPFSADHGHIHHRLIALGFNQKQTVGILYAICGMLGISAVMFTIDGIPRATALIIIALSIFFVNFIFLKNPATRDQAGLGLLEKNEEETSSPDQFRDS